MPSRLSKFSSLTTSVVGVVLASVVALGGVMPANAVEVAAPSSEAAPLPGASTETTEAAPANPKLSDEATTGTEPTETASGTEGQFPTDLTAETPRHVQTSQAAIVTNIPTMNIELPTGYSLDTLNASRDKIPANAKSEPHSKLTLTDSTTSANDLANVGVEEIKTRGNFTSTLEKKPYQIKFDSATSLLGMPQAKTWILLANHADPSLMRNKVALDLAAQFGMPGSPDARFVDLHINGDYQGNYLVTEKVEVKANRLDLADPGGLLLELDNSYGESEDFHFTTSVSESTFVLKDAVQKITDPLPTQLAASYQGAQDYLNRFEALLYAPDPDWSQISSMIDVDSFIEYYFVLEFSENPDAVTSSVYYWRDGPDDVLQAGPAWDFDIGFGLYPSASLGADPGQDYIKNGVTLRGGGTAWFEQLFRNPEFAEQAGEVYETRLRGAVESSVARLDADIASLQASSAANFQRWPNVLGLPSVIAGARPAAATWEEETKLVRDWVAQRVAYLDSVYSADMPILTYAAHSAQVGWQPTLTSGQFAGTTGDGLQLEALSVGLAGNAGVGAIQSHAHVQDIGWTPWGVGGTTLGTTGRGLRLEAVGFSLSSRLAADFDIEYRAHVQNLGWMPWVSNGETAGTTGRGLRVEAVQLRLLKKSESISGASIAYSTHLSQVGWTRPVTDGAESGAVGRGVSLEALRASIASSEDDGTLSLRSHVQDIGWSDWGLAPGIAGTEGMGLRMEALQLRLDGDIATHFRVRYRAYVQDAGWQQWVTGGQTAGTTGQGRRIEAVQIELTPKV